LDIELTKLLEDNQVKSIELKNYLNEINQLKIQVNTLSIENSSLKQNSDIKFCELENNLILTQQSYNDFKG
jgi:hypothetical protein